MSSLYCHLQVTVLEDCVQVSDEIYQQTDTNVLPIASSNKQHTHWICEKDCAGTELIDA